jgi:hypothetical protein
MMFKLDMYCATSLHNSITGTNSLCKGSIDEYPSNGHHLEKITKKHELVRKTKFEICILLFTSRYKMLIILFSIITKIHHVVGQLEFANSSGIYYQFVTPRLLEGLRLN